MNRKRFQAVRLPLTGLHEILSTHLAPMFPGTVVLDSPIPTAAHDVVMQPGPCEVLLKPDPNQSYCFRLQKTSPFDSDDLQIITTFTRALHEKLVAADAPFFSYLVEKCPQDVVASSMQPRFADDHLLPSIIALLKRWASETYEGQRISVAVGIDPSADRSRISNVHFSQITAHDYAKVLSNGMDTLLVLSSSGHVVEHVSVEATAPSLAGVASSAFAPRRHQSLADWTRKARVAVALNRHGELLVFRNQRLRFAFRRGVWSHFAHTAMIARLGGTQNLMRAVYATCLDVSFSRTGSCIAVVESAKESQLSKYLSSNDKLATSSSEKAVVLRHLIGTRFEKIPRSIREELAAIDGAVVLDHRGVVLAVGAIVSLSGGSDAGGRKAAAKALSRLGVAIKVSADGGITAYTKHGTKKQPEIAFEVCV